ncbi:MAG: MalY/PatB family protein [Sporolactobacillus sp.]
MYLDELIDRRESDSVKWNDEILSQNNRADIIPMWIADMDFKAPQEVLDAIKKCADFGVFGYTRCPDRVTDSIHNWLKMKYQWEIDKQSIILNHNVVSSLSLALRALTEEGDKVLIHSPVYNPFFEQIKHLNRRVVSSALRVKDARYVMDFEDMEQKIDREEVRCILICSPHNPGGRIWSEEELEKVLELSKTYHIPVISDEIHSDLVLFGKTHHPIAKLAGDDNAQIVTLMAPTKTFNLAGIGPSYILSFNKKLTERIKYLQTVMVYPQINRFQIEAICAAYQYGCEWLRQLLSYIEQNISLAKNILAAIPELQVMKQDASYLMWVDYKKLAISEEVLRTALIEASVFPQMGSIYGPEGNHCIRINIAAPRQTVEEGLRRIVKAFQSVRAKVQN